jgi:hypothetical protein
MKDSDTIDWDNWELCIRIAGNTWPRSLMAIREKGYDIRIYYAELNKEKEDYQSFYEAKKDGRYFSASNPVELLGLIAMWEVRGDNWREVTEEDWEFYDKLDDEAKVYDEEGNDVTDDD